MSIELPLEFFSARYEYSMVKTHWGVTFKKTGSKLIEFDVTHFIQNIGPEPKIIMFIAHQDEQKSMQELGLLSNGCAC